MEGCVRFSLNRNTAITRTLAISVALTLLALRVSSASAAEVTLQKLSSDELKAVCQKVGGSFSPDKTGYGCGTNCKGAAGTDCTVYCPETAKKCTAK